jgi:hypothetical protein
MDLHIGHSMSSASVCSRREPSKIAQGKRSAALGKRQTEGSRPGGADRTLAPRIAESNDGAGLSHRPSGAGIPWSNPSPGFHYFRLFPPGRTALNASLFPRLELLVMQHGIKTVQAIPCFRGHQLVYFDFGQDLRALCFCLSLSHFQIAFSPSVSPLFH